MINFLHLAQSIEHYQQLNYVRLEAPWWVTQEIANLTKPEGARDYFIPENNKVLVASAEQSFLYLANKGLLPPGTFQATTPCFRNEPIDLLHHKHFIKNELINTKNTTDSSLNQMIEHAMVFFSKYISKDKLKIEATPAKGSSVNFDILATVNGKDLELGSYGIKECEILKWIYGTGCAEPRLSLIIDRIKLENK